MMDAKTEMGISTTNGLEKSDGVGLLNYIQNCSQLSSISVAPESSVINFVYQRKKISKNHSSVIPTPSLEKINLVYERRKNQKSALINYPETRVSSMDHPLTTSETIDGYITEDRNIVMKDKMNKNIELYSVDDSCSSSSMLDIEMGSSPLKSKVDDTDECSSSGTLVVDLTGDDQNLSVKNLCVSILKSHGLLSNSKGKRSNEVEEDTPSCSGSGSRSCNVCGVRGKANEMLICDECEEAFHLYCFNPSVRKPPIDDWYCQPCSRKKHNLLKERAARRSSIIRTGKDPMILEEDCSLISLMLQDSAPYKSGVRVGKGFQAIVPEWCGLVPSGDSYPEPMELDPSQSVNFSGPLSGKLHKAFIGNWLQCRDIVVGIGDHIDGTICGKWRRAPLFEVQTDNWDCFSSVFWDPTHADCAAPQEMETEEVLRQLKYIELLRPRLAAKKRKLEAFKANGIEDASKCTGSIDIEKNS